MMCLPPGLEYGERHVISPTGENPPEYRDLEVGAQRKTRK
jgi:hypothetical protein